MNARRSTIGTPRRLMKVRPSYPLPFEGVAAGGLELERLAKSTPPPGSRELRPLVIPLPAYERPIAGDTKRQRLLAGDHAGDQAGMLKMVLMESTPLVSAMLDR